MKTAEQRKDLKFYVCLGLAYSLLMISLFLPPLNVITESVLYAGIVLLGCGALATGIDLQGILHEINELKRLSSIKESKEL